MCSWKGVFGEWGVRLKKSKKELIYVDKFIGCDWSSSEALEYRFTTNFAVTLLLLYSAECRFLFGNSVDAFEA